MPKFHHKSTNGNKKQKKKKIYPTQITNTVVTDPRKNNLNEIQDTQLKKTIINMFSEFSEFKGDKDRHLNEREGMNKPKSKKTHMTK